MSDHPISNMMDTTLQKIREIVDASTVIGDPISAGGTTIVPVSRISYGFASGGSDIPTKQPGDCFGGGGGAGVTVQPVAFLVVSGSDVRLLQVESFKNATDRALGSIPDILDKIRDMIQDGKKKKDQAADELEF